MSDSNRGGRNTSTSGLPITGQVGAVPPPHAPREVSQPLQPEALARAGVLAKQNARVLAPLKFEQIPPVVVRPPAAPHAGPVTGADPPSTDVASLAIPPVAAFADRMSGAPLVAGGEGATPSKGSAVAQVREAARRLLRKPGAVNASGVERPAVVAEVVPDADAQTMLSVDDGTEHVPAPGPTAGQPAPTALPASPAPLTIEEEFPLPDPSLFPAASNSDSPSRGQPRYEPDPNKRVTGGFGMPEDAAGGGGYFALDGTELLELVRSLLDEVNTRIANDLRFSMAICYPRVTARVVIEVQGFAQDADCIIDRVRVHDKTPLATAVGLAEDICFVVKAEAREVDADGNPERPPNAVREALGLVVPRKQVVTDATKQRHWVDKVVR